MITMTLQEYMKRTRGWNLVLPSSNHTTETPTTEKPFDKKQK